MTPPEFRNRSEELRRRTRWIFGVSIAVAALVHAAVLFLGPDFTATPIGHDLRPDPGLAGSDFALQLPVDVLFGPPTILLNDGTTWTEPPERVLETRDVEAYFGLDNPECGSVQAIPDGPARAEVRLRLNSWGRVTSARPVRPEERIDPGAGPLDPCVAQVAAKIAGALWYHWLPDERFGAPVELVQPLTITPAP